MPDIYGDAAQFRAYHAERGNVIELDVEDAEIDVCLLVGSEWMDDQFRNHLTGLKINGRDQIREQPRSGQIDAFGYGLSSDEIPREYLHATFEISYKHLITPGILNQDYTPGKYESVSVDGAVSVKFRKFNSVAELQTNFAKVGQLMSTLIATGSVASSFSGSSLRS